MQLDACVDQGRGRPRRRPRPRERAIIGHIDGDGPSPPLAAYALRESALRYNAKVFACPFGLFGKSYAYYEKDLYPYRTINGGCGRAANRLQWLGFKFYSGTQHQRASRYDQQVGRYSRLVWEYQLHAGRHTFARLLLCTYRVGNGIGPACHQGCRAVFARQNRRRRVPATLARLHGKIYP